MSSKVKSSATKGGGVALVPERRFPEFQTAGAWDNKPLSEVLSPVVRERSKPTEPYTGLGLRSHGKGTFLKENEDPAKNAMDVLFEVKRDDLIVNITFAWEGAIAIASRSDDGALVSHRFPTYAFNLRKALPGFFRYRIIEKQFIYNLGVISPGGAGRNRVMSKADFLKLRVLLPKPDEQQKIAECLDSADALIEAQGRKVEALKAYKKGLMQQLFPQEGERQPRLRFPEFEGTGVASTMSGARSVRRRMRQT
jgi:type I restriction enzyme S subunit